MLNLCIATETEQVTRKIVEELQKDIDKIYRELSSKSSVRYDKLEKKLNFLFFIGRPKDNDLRKITKDTKAALELVDQTQLKFQKGKQSKFLIYS